MAIRCGVPFAPMVAMVAIRLRSKKSAISVSDITISAR
jgi:hypothetical protein